MCHGIEVLSLWHCVGVKEAQIALIVAFRSPALLELVSLIFLLTTARRFPMGFGSGTFAGQSRTGTPWSLNQLLVPLEVWAGVKSYWKINSASSYSLSVEGGVRCCQISWQTAALTTDFRKPSGSTPTDDMAPQTTTDCENVTLDLEQSGFCASPLFLQNPETLISK